VKRIKLGLEYIKQSKATTGLEDLTTAALKFQSFVEIYGANSIIDKKI
jgi:hypothetical protein